MKISLNTIQELTNLKIDASELVSKINAQLGQVESVEDLGKKYIDARIVRVVECEKHADADKLSVCQIDTGEGEASLTQVVCGAPNVHAGMWAIWLPPGSTVPSSFGEQDPFVLEAREIRGVVSNGMLAAADELAIGSDHEGIIEISQADLPPNSDMQLAAGLSFAEAFGLNDVVIELENKMFTHRPDCFGQLGVAREIFAIMQPEPADDKSTETHFSEPDWYWSLPQFDSADALPLTVKNDAPDVVPRFMAVALKDVEVRPSPLWLQVELVRWGSKPINNIVDATNYIMLLSAQPTHAYDYDKLAGHTIGARRAQKGETIKLLNDKTYTLDEQDIVIVDGEAAIGLAGIMGGMDSEVTPETKNVVLECATFDMYAVRKSSMRYGLFTDAVTRFNKGQSWLQNDRVLVRLMELISAKQASQVYDLPVSSDRSAEATIHQPIEVTPAFINQRLGLNLSGYTIANILRFVNFATYPADLDPNSDLADAKDFDENSALLVNAPFWRTDIDEPEDIVEEVGRLYGLDKLPVKLPRRDIAPAATNPNIQIKQIIRAALCRAGANEALTYSFVHANTLKKAEQDAAQAFKLTNALSPDLQYYRLSVLPSLLDRVHANIKTSHDEFVLFEIGKGHNKKYHLDDDEGLPAEMEFVDAVYASKTARSGAAFYRAKRVVEQLAKDLKLRFVFKPIVEKLDFPVTAPFDLSRSASVETIDGEVLGIVGELKLSVVRAFKLPSYSAAFSIDLSGLLKAYNQVESTYVPLSRFPSLTQDISLKVAIDTTYDELYNSAIEGLKQALPVSAVAELTPVSIYQPDEATKTISLRLKVSDFERTMTDGEVAGFIDSIASQAALDLKAEVS